MTLSTVSPGSRLLYALQTSLPALLLALAALLAWHVLAHLFYADRAYLLPAPVDVLAAMIEHRHELALASWITVREALTGLAMSTLAGLLIAIALNQFRWLERSLYPYTIVLQTVPVIAVAPLIVLWFGYNSRSVIVISFIMSLFPIINNALLGLRSTSPTLLDLFRLQGSGRGITLLKLQLPAATPHILAGLRISAGLAVIGALVGEFIIGSGDGQAGLGVQIIFAQARMHTALLFGQVIAASLLGVAFFALIHLAGQAWLRRWHESGKA